jgi:uncharacterized protein YycO
MMSPRPGDFGIVPMRRPVGMLIRIGQWITRDSFADYEHAFVYVNDGMIVEAMPGGAIISRASNYSSTRTLTYRCPDDKSAAIVIAAMGLLGTPYSFADYLALAAVRFRLPFGGLLRQYVASSKHMICSQLVDEAYLRAGVHLFDDGRLPGDVTPVDLYILIMVRKAKEFL